MIDGIIKADGTSRLMRANLPATYEEFKTQAAAGTLPLDVLFNESGWSQFPTFLNKANLLRDNTAALFGLNADAVPDDALSYLGQYNLHWWKTTATSTTSAHYTMGGLTSSGQITAVGTVYYKGSSIAVDANGNLSIPNETSVVPTNTATSVAGSYIRCEASDGNKFYYCDTGSTIKKYGTNTLTLTNYKVVTGHPAVTNVGAVAYLQSTERNTYPHSGTVNGLEYEYLGIPFDNSVNAPKIATGSYTGTGTYGASNPNSLTFDFVPKMLFILESSKDGRPIFSIFCTWPEALSSSYAHYGYTALTSALTITGTKAFAKFTGTTFSWYATDSARNQMNSNEYNYRYIAIC